MIPRGSAHLFRNFGLSGADCRKVHGLREKTPMEIPQPDLRPTVVKASKNLQNRESSVWCAREDLNLQSFRNQILSLARLPFRPVRNAAKDARDRTEPQAGSLALLIFAESSATCFSRSRIRWIMSGNC